MHVVHWEGHLRVAGAKSSTEGMGSTVWEQGAGRGPGKQMLNPSCPQSPSAQLPFFHVLPKQVLSFLQFF